MKLPSKITSYAESVLSKFPIILEAISEDSLPISVLYEKTKSSFIGIEEYLDVLDCLFAVQSIGLDEEGGKIRRVA